MKNAGKAPKRNLVNFAEQLSAAPEAKLTPKAEARKSEPNKTRARRPATVEEPAKAVAPEAPLPVRPPAEVVTTAQVLAEPVSGVVLTGRRRSTAPKGWFVIGVLALAMIVAGPPLMMVAGALAYPAVIVLLALAGWKIYDLFRGPAGGK